MRRTLSIFAVTAATLTVVLAKSAPVAAPQDPVQAPAAAPAAQTPAANPQIHELVAQLDLEKYKATIKGLTQFGDRRQATQRNHDAVAWIEAQLKSYGYTNAERIWYDPPVPRAGARGCGPSVPPTPAAPGAAGAGTGGGRNAGAGTTGATGGTGATAAGTGGRANAARGTGGGGAGAGTGADAGAATDPDAAPARGRGIPGVSRPTPTGGDVGRGSGTASNGAVIWGYTARTGVNCDPMAQPDEAIRALDSLPTIPGKVSEVYVTKVGTTHPEEMYIIGAHMDGHGYNQAVNDDGSGTALVMEIARAFMSPGVTTERSIRFALWNGEEGGLNGARAYVAQRQALQGKEDPPGSGKYPEPKWLAMIQHDMMMWDHGMPKADGTVSKEQRPEADVNIEFQSLAKFADEAMKLAFVFKAANDKYATDYPATVGPHMTNTDSDPFKDIIPALSLRENERGPQTGGGWNPTWHTPLDVLTTFSDKDYRLGLNAAQTTLAALAQLTGMKIKK